MFNIFAEFFHSATRLDAPGTRSGTVTSLHRDSTQAIRQDLAFHYIKRSTAQEQIRPTV